MATHCCKVQTTGPFVDWESQVEINDAVHLLLHTVHREGIEVHFGLVDLPNNAYCFHDGILQLFWQLVFRMDWRLFLIWVLPIDPPVLVDKTTEQGSQLSLIQLVKNILYHDFSDVNVYLSGNSSFQQDRVVTHKFKMF